MVDETITVNGVPVDEYLTGVKEKKITEETTADFHQTLHRSSQDKSTLKRSRQTFTGRGKAVERANAKCIGVRSQPYSKNGAITRYDMWDLAIEGERNMAYQDMIEVLRDSSRANMFDVEMLLQSLKHIVERPPTLDKLKSLLRVLWRDNIINAYCVREGQFFPYPEHSSTQRMYFLLAANDDEREDFLAMSDDRIKELLEAFTLYCNEMFGPFNADDIGPVKENPMGNALKAKVLYEHIIAKILCQVNEPVAVGDIQKKMKNAGYRVNDASTVRNVVKRLVDYGMVIQLIQHGGVFKEVKTRPKGSKMFFQLIPLEDLPLEKFMSTPEAEPEINADTPDVVEEEQHIGLPQAVNSYDDIIDQIFPPQKPEVIETVKGPGLRGIVSSHVAGREIFDIIRSAGKVVSAGTIQQELRDRGFTKTGSTAIRRAMTLLVQANLVNLYTKNNGKTTKVDSIIPGKSMSAKFMKPLDQPALSQPENKALQDMESSDNGLDEEALPVVVQDEQKEVIAEAAPIVERAAQAEPAAIDMDSFVTMLKQQGVKRFEIEF